MLKYNKSKQKIGGKGMYNKKAQSNRQRRMYLIIECLNEGITDTKQIAEELGVSRRTIQNDIKYIREHQNEQTALQSIFFTKILEKQDI